MKSQSLLPGRDDTEPDEEFVGWEERDVLLARLLELRTYAALADAFVSLLERAGRAYPRLRGIDDGFVVDRRRTSWPGSPRPSWPWPTCAASRRSPCRSCACNHVTVDAVSVAETVVSLSQRLPALGGSRFAAVEGFGTRIEVIVHFLALLELCKLGHVTLGQGATFGDVQIEWIDVRVGLDIGRVDSL
jgi:segregation and condensation protein A